MVDKADNIARYVFGSSNHAYGLVECYINRRIAFLLYNLAIGLYHIAGVHAAAFGSVLPVQAYAALLYHAVGLAAAAQPRIAYVLVQTYAFALAHGWY